MSRLVSVGGQLLDPNIPSQQQAIFDAGLVYYQGEWIPNTTVPGYVHPAQEPPTPWVSPAITNVGNTLFGTMQNASPGVMINAVLAGTWSGFDVNDIAGGLAVIRAYSLEVYGSVDLGTVRYSSEVLENEPTGVRPGTMERIVIPAWARRERGSPL